MIISRISKIKILLVLLLSLAITTGLPTLVLADYQCQNDKQSCNTNDHCRAGFYCNNGTPDNGSANFTGCCVVVGPFRGLCIIMAILQGNFGKSIVAIVFISLGGAFMLGKLDTKQIMTVAVGIMCIWGPAEILSIISGNAVMVICDNVNLQEPLGWSY